MGQCNPMSNASSLANFVSPIERKGSNVVNTYNAMGLRVLFVCLHLHFSNTSCLTLTASLSLVLHLPLCSP